MSNQLKDLIESDVKQNIVVIDGHNLIFRTIHIAEKQITQFGVEQDDTFSYWKYLFVKSIVNVISTFDPTRLVIAMDVKKNWRRDYYSEYKATRKAARDKSKIDFETFFPVLDKFYEEMQEAIANIMYLKIDRCEGDDIMGVISTMYPDATITLISTDRDLNQLLKRKNVKQYDPIKRKYTESLNPIVDLEAKIITGDKGDNVPAIKPKCGPATAASLISKGTLEALLESNPEIKANYERNRILIDLDYIPEEIKTAIKDTINSYTLKKFDGRKFFGFVIKNRLSAIMDNVQETNTILSRLDEHIGAYT